MNVHFTSASTHDRIYTIHQTRRARVPVCPWTGAGLPGGRSTACRWTFWSTTPAFIIDVGTGCIPMTRLSTIGDRAFPIAAARTWNSLPSEVTSLQCLRTFKTTQDSSVFHLFPIADCKVTAVPLEFFTLNFIVLFCTSTLTPPMHTLVYVKIYFRPTQPSIRPGIGKSSSGLTGWPLELRRGAFTCVG